MLCLVQDLKGQDSGHYAPLMRRDPETGRVSLIFFWLDIKAEVQMDDVLFKKKTKKTLHACFKRLFLIFRTFPTVRTENIRSFLLKET